jgi:hypothetical protein
MAEAKIKVKSKDFVFKFLKHDRKADNHVSMKRVFSFHIIEITFFVYFRNIHLLKIHETTDGLLQNCAPIHLI